LWVVLLIIVINWIMNAVLDTSRLVHLTQFSPGVSSFIDVILSLEVEDGSYSNVFHFLNISIINTIWTNEDVLVMDLVDIEVL